MSCQCGAAKVYGIKAGQVGHSAWCPDSPFAERKIPKQCEGYDEVCFSEPSHWLQYSVTGPKLYYCKGCLYAITKFSYTPIVATGVI